MPDGSARRAAAQVEAGAIPHDLGRLVHVVLDANAIGVDPPLGKIEHRLLLDAHRSGEIVLVVPRLALREAVNGWKRLMRTQTDKLANTRQPFAAWSQPFIALVRSSSASTSSSFRLDSERIADRQLRELIHLG